MKIVYIHGASATAESWNYIRDNIGGDDHCLEYHSDNGFKNNLDEMSKFIETETESVFFVAHSLGGIYALHLANMFPKKTVGGVCLSTPYGGSKSADYAKYFLPFSRLMRDIGPNSWPMQASASIDIRWPWMNIVTTKGQSPWITEHNDGVVTVESQQHHGDTMELVEIKLNHYEVMLSPKVVKLIKTRLPAAG